MRLRTPTFLRGSAPLAERRVARVFDSRRQVRDLPYRTCPPVCRDAACPRPIQGAHKAHPFILPNPQSAFRTPQSRENARSAFSLIEVVLAVGIFAMVIISVIGLLGPTVRSVREVVDSTIAARLADGVDAELRRVGFAGVVAATAGNGLIPLVATVDGARIVSETDAGNAPIATPPGIPRAERYYLVEVRRAVAPAYNAGDASLVLTIRVTWPYQQPGAAAAVAATDRLVFIFNTAVVP